jgi:glycosyltransferase involved in cell wall biosynthesis
VPPRRYEPWEQFVSLLTEGLVERGVDVTLFASGDSRTIGGYVVISDANRHPRLSYLTEEPFGFSVVEAMACGTPVVAFRPGLDARTHRPRHQGLLVDNVDQVVEAVALAGRLDRPQIRGRAVSRFGRDRMVDEYLAAYTLLLNVAGRRYEK